MFNIIQEKQNVKYNNKEPAKNFKNIFDSIYNSNVISSLRLKDIAPANAGILNKRKSHNIEIAKHVYKKANVSKNNTILKRAGRIYACRQKGFYLVANDKATSLLNHRCRDRLCPYCQRIRSFLLQDQIKQIVPRVSEERDNDSFLMPTFTVKNPLIEDENKVMSAMSWAHSEMLRREPFTKFLIGGFRCFETTRGKTGPKHCHPHIHDLWQVKNSYFCNYYLSEKKLSAIWTMWLKKGFKRYGLEWNDADYPDGAIVNIRRLLSDKGIEKNKINEQKKKERKKKKKTGIELTAEDDLEKLAVEDYLTTKNFFDNDNAERAIYYVTKYMTKDDSIFNGDNWSWEHDKQIRGKRLISFFGAYKEEKAKIKKENTGKYYNEKEFLDNIKDKCNLDEIKDSHIFLAGFSEKEKEYYVEKSTLETAFFNKRFSIVKSIENKKVEMDIFKKAMNIDYDKNIHLKMQLYDDAPTSRNLKELNNSIIELNEEKKAKRRDHRRLVDCGHRVMINEYEYYMVHDRNHVYDIFDFCADLDLVEPECNIFIDSLNFIDCLSQLDF